MNVGKYQDLEVAGSGTTATVYKAHDPFCGRHVAIKLSHPTPAGLTRRTRQLFFNEAHITGSLVHPHIVQLLDAGEHEGTPYLVMEYIEGGATMARYCQTDHLLDAKSAASVVYHTAKALAYSHSNHIIHRDIKPSNIMVSPDGTVKLTDFGIAQQDLGQTQPLGVMGSPAVHVTGTSP